jgi:hypothetical protein
MINRCDVITGEWFCVDLMWILNTELKELRIAGIHRWGVRLVDEMEVGI